jgi:hypothetical protein
MRILSVLALTCIALSGCTSSPTTTAASCPSASAIIGGYLYVGSFTASADQAGARFAVVQRQRECMDVVTTVEGEPAPVFDSWVDGDATRLVPGTVLYSAVGHPDGSRLVGQDPERGWVVLDRQSRIR